MPHPDQDLWDRAHRLMPWGTQTNAKRPDPAMGEAMPWFIDAAEGCRVRDRHGRTFIDYRSALGPILLGYRHPEVDEAVRAQMGKGVLFSMASPLEADVAEQLVGLVPGLEQVRFLKTGNDANMAAVRLARVHTGRDHLVTCGYHGFGDWFASGTGAPPMLPRPNNGVPTFLDPYVHRIAYGDLEALEAVFAEHGDAIGALLMVPHDWGEDVAHAFVRRARALTEQHGAVLIFDQVLTGFRLAVGGAQTYFGVTPDLSTYAKALANGYPLSVVGGTRALMQGFESAFITTTYAGEALSLAAAQATLRVLEREPVIEHLERMGRRLQEGFDSAAADLGLAARAYGLPQAPQFRFADDPDQHERLQQTFMRTLFAEGIFPARPMLLSYAHREADIDQTLAAIRNALERVAETQNDAQSSTPSPS